MCFFKKKEESVHQRSSKKSVGYKGIKSKKNMSLYHIVVISG